MYILTDQFVFLHLMKTGGSFVREFFQRTTPDHKWLINPEGKGVHRGADHIPLQYRHLPRFGIVRNPWDWYVSWYEFFTIPERAYGFFRLGKTKSFKDVLYRCLFERTDQTKASIGMDFRKAREDDIGVLTYLFHHIFDEAGQMSDVKLLRFEQLRDDMLQFLPLTTRQKKLLLTYPVVNPTPNRRPYPTYYDRESIGWIGHKDRELVERFNYSFNPIAR